MIMEEYMKMRDAQPVPTISRPNFLRYKFKKVRKNSNVFRTADETHLDWRYWHSFSIEYEHLEVSTFFKTKGWYLREKKIMIPKIINSTLRFLFGKRYYSVSRTYDDVCTSHTEMVDYKTMKEYIKEFEEEGCTDIYISMKEIRYEGWHWITKKEQKNEKGMLNFMVNMWS